MTDYRSIIRKNIELIITNDLTIGRTDDELEPFTEEQIKKFIDDNHDGIEKVIDNMITDYTEDDELETLKEPLMDWFTEYLYEVVKTRDFQ